LMFVSGQGDFAPTAALSGVATAVHTGSGARGTVTAEPGAQGCMLESMLEAWASCRPVGCTLPAAELPTNLPTIACHVHPGVRGRDPAVQAAVARLFEPNDEDQVPLFQQMLKVHAGQVQFLWFWRAFSRAGQVVAAATTSCSECKASSAGSSPMVASASTVTGGLMLELETFRDGLLRKLESGDSETVSAQQVPLAAVVGAVRLAAALSENANFWQSVEKALDGVEEDGHLSVEDLTLTILQWLRYAVVRTSLQERPWHPLKSDCEAGRMGSKASESHEGLPVFVNIYDVSQEESVHKLNKWLANRRSPLKFGGVFHAGIEVNGLEWSFGLSLVETLPGISCCKPRVHPAHRFRQTHRLKNTTLSAEDIGDMISKLLEEYPGSDYDLLRRNCCHFADDFSRRLGAGRIPRWVHRLARVGAQVDGLMQAVSGKKLLPDLIPDDEDAYSTDEE